MRPVLVLSLLVSIAGTLSAEAPPKSSESDLVRAYYQAAKANDFGEANAAFQELSERFPDDDLTKLVADHWNRRLKEEDPKSWKNVNVIRNTRAKSLKGEPIVTVVYQIADLVAPLPPNELNRQKSEGAARAFMKMISDTLDQFSAEEGLRRTDSVPAYHPETLSMVVQAPQSIHKKLETVLSQMRRQQDLKNTYHIKIVSVPAEIANTWALRESLSPNEFRKRMEGLEQNQKFGVLMSPRVTTFDGQIAHKDTRFSHITLHGIVSKDRRSTSLEIMLSGEGDSDVTNWSFSASETIPDGHTGVFFIKSEDAPSKFLDRRLLIEKGIEVAPSTANQRFAFITAKIIMTEEEQELLGVVKENTSTTETSSPRPPVQAWPAYATSPSLPAYAWPTHGSKYPSYPYSHPWPPVKLNWDDGYWNLDFDVDNKTIQNAITTPEIILPEEEELPEKSVSSTEFPWARPPIPSVPAHATFPPLPSVAWPSYASKCSSMPPEFIAKQTKLDWDDWNWEPNLAAVSKNAQQVIDAWDLNWPSQAIHYRKEKEVDKQLPQFTPPLTR